MSTMPYSPQRLSPNISRQFFLAYWCSPVPLQTDPTLYHYTLSVHTLDQLKTALDLAHAVGVVRSLTFAYSKGNFNGSLVCPLIEWPDEQTKKQEQI